MSYREEKGRGAAPLARCPTSSSSSLRTLRAAPRPRALSKCSRAAGAIGGTCSAWRGQRRGRRAAAPLHDRHYAGHVLNFG